MSAKYQTSRCLFTGISALVMMLSVAVIGFSVDALHKFSYATSLLGSNVLNYGAVILLLVGILSFILTPIGLYALVVQHSPLLTVFTLCIFGVSFMSLVGAMLGFSLHFELDSGSLRTWMMAGLHNEYGHTHGFDVTLAWDRVQSELKCCGVDDPNEWVESDWFVGQVRFPRRRRPSSCCHTCSSSLAKYCGIYSGNAMVGEEMCAKLKKICNIREDVHSLTDNSVCTGTNVPPKNTRLEAFVHSKGCFVKLENHLMFYAVQMMISGTVIGVFLLLSAIISFILTRATDPLLAYDAVNTCE